MKKHTLTLLMLTSVALAGCGQTGALYLPEDAPEPVNTEAVTIKGSDGSVTKQSETESEQQVEQSTQSESEQQAQ